MREKADFEVLDPVDKIRQKSKDIDRLRSIGWIMETNYVAKIVIEKKNKQAATKTGGGSNSISPLSEDPEGMQSNSEAILTGKE